MFSLLKNRKNDKKKILELRFYIQIIYCESQKTVSKQMLRKCKQKLFKIAIKLSIVKTSFENIFSGRAQYIKRAPGEAN